MRSIFLKIFLWFWLTLVVVGIVLSFVYSIQPELVLSRWRASTGSAVTLYAQSAAEVLDRYGQSALEKYLARVQQSGHVTAAILDENGLPLAGNAPPEAARIIPLAKLGGMPEYIIKSDSAFAAQRVAGPSGRVYVFVAEMPRGPVGAFHWPLPVILYRWGIEALVSGVICFVLARYLTRPILRLRTAAAEIASGELSARADEKMEKRRDEIGELVHDFNHMASRIESLVTSQRRLVRDISHELRSPLARLTVALELARKRTGEQQAATLDRIELEAERLNDMIGKLLSLARIESFSAPPEKIEIDLHEMLSQVVADADFEARQRECRVELIGEEECKTLANPEMLRSAVENVIRNAVRYTASGTAVTVNLKRWDTHNMAEITVRDHGPGVPENELRNLFRPFYRVGQARQRETGGTGLGLAITDRSIRLHGGKVEAANSAEGGLIVSIQIPCDLNGSKG